ncbi:DUF4229 domain-containing protein, partial [Streptomyces nodosus]
MSEGPACFTGIRPTGSPRTPGFARTGVTHGTEEWIEMLRYTLMRLGIFAGCLVLTWGLVYSGLVPRGLGDSNGIWVV